MVEHKIQSSDGFKLELDQVPNKLGNLTVDWAKEVSNVFISLLFNFFFAMIICATLMTRGCHGNYYYCCCCHR